MQKHSIEGFAEVKFKPKPNEKYSMLKIKILSHDEANEILWNEAQQILDIYITRNETTRIVIDLQSMMYSMNYINKWAQFFKQNKVYLRDCVLYVAFICDNVIVNNFLKIAISISPPLIPFHVLTNKDELSTIEKLYST